MAVSSTNQRRFIACFALLAALGLGCSADEERGDGSGPGGSGGDGDGDGDRDSGIDNPDPVDPGDGGSDGGEQGLDLALSPDPATLRVVRGEDLPTLQFEVTNHGRRVPAVFRVENGELGRIDDDGLFTPSGTRGGSTLIEARVGQRTLLATLVIEMEWTQNGQDPAHPVVMSAGGFGGVGGEGIGGAVDDAVRATLDGEPIEDAGLTFLYPYDETVFPLGMLAPLLMWTPGEATVADAILLRVSGGGFEYTGYFGRPEPLAAGADFVRHPIPQEVWESATKTVAGGTLTVELSVAKGDKLYGPIQRELKIARGSLKGTVYYQSYGTHLAKNYGGAIGGDGRFGGATLAIKPGAIEPELVAGGTGGHDQCRVCHSVSSDGSRMTVQHGDSYETTSSYDLLNGNMERVYDAGELRSQLAWIGLTPDGAYGLANGQPLGVGGDPVTRLYDMESGAVVPTTGLEEIVREASFPAFSHDGRKVAFNFANGPGDATIGMGDGKKLVALDFDPMTNAFSSPSLLYEGELPAGWPSFSPTGNGVIYQVQTQRGSGPDFETRYGAKGELWWTSLETGEAHRLDRVNGVHDGASYLPKADNNHMEDEQLNYEPTVAPIASGGYAWIVFTSRRMYGNVATIDPWHSDPREHDLNVNPTPKKLWVAAIKLDVDTEEVDIDVGDDPSFPAFYLPGQELLAGNARGFWVVDPCKPDGDGCESGVECCTGYCQEDTDGELTCGKKTDECSAEFDRCDTAADCCDPDAACVNNVCSRLIVE